MDPVEGDGCGWGVDHVEGVGVDPVEDEGGMWILWRVWVWVWVGCRGCGCGCSVDPVEGVGGVECGSCGGCGCGWGVDPV